MCAKIKLFMLFKVSDYQNTPVIFSKDTWQHKLLDPIFGHPEIKPFLSQIKSTIRNPENVYQSIRDTRSKLLCTKIQSGLYTSYFLVVVIKYIKEQGKIIGYVSTAMINRKLPKSSKLIWAKKVLT